MARYTVIVDRLSDWKWNAEGLVLLTADDYLTRNEKNPTRAGRIINLCRRYTYLSGGYYVSLLAEARRELPMPTVADILDLSKRSLYAFALPELEQTLNAACSKAGYGIDDVAVIYIYFGRTEVAGLKKFAAQCFDLFRYPALEVHVKEGADGRLSIRTIKPVGLNDLKSGEVGAFERAIRDFTKTPVRKKPDRKPALYDIAILYDPNEALPPSDPDALARFVKAGRDLRVDVEMITAKDYDRLTEFDALFIRETTALDHHTFRFARKAQAEGMPVIDDPTSILRCTNKVYMAELLAGNGVPAPKTIAINRSEFGEKKIADLETRLGYPMVLKIPDGSFSRGVVKAESRDALIAHASKLLERSRIVLAQAFMYTAYDWRIGVLAGKPLFACQYAMSRNHWQIYRHQDDGKVDSGGFKTFALEDVPELVLNTAQKAAGLIGDGLYGVDVKENDDGVFVIEINDNPNIDHGVEDKVLKGELYRRVIQDLAGRVEANLRG